MARTTTAPEFSPTRIFERDTVSATHLLGIPADSGLHVERGIARPHGVILVRERRAEQRHDAVTHDLVHGALVPVDRLHHAFEHGVQEFARLLRDPGRRAAPSSP